MDFTKKAFSNIIYLYLDWIFTTLFSFFFWLIIGKTLLPDQYGIIVTIINFVTIVSNISFFGFTTALSKLIPEYKQRNDFPQMRDLIKFSTKIVLASNAILAFTLFVLSSTIATNLNVPTDAVLIGTLLLFAMSISGLLGAIIYGSQNMKKLFFTDVLGYAVKLVASLVLVLVGLRYFGALAAISMGFITIIVSRLDLRKLYRGKSNHMDRKMVVVEYAIPAFIASLASTIFSNTQTIVLSILKGITVTGVFGVAMTVTLPIYSIPNILSTALFPITSQLSAHKKGRGQQIFLIGMILRYSLFITLPIVLIFSFFSKPLILLFSRPEYLGAAPLFLPLSFGCLFFAIGGIFSSTIYAIKHPRLQRNILVTSVAVFLMLVITLTILFSSIGLTCAYLLSTFFYTAISFFYLKKHLDLRLPIKDIAKMAVSLAGFLTVLVVSDLLDVSLPVKIVIAALGFLVYLLLLLMLRFYKKIDIMVLQYVEERVPKIKPIIVSIEKLISNHISKD